MKHRKYLHSVHPINTVFISFLQKIEITTEKTYSKKINAFALVSQRSCSGRVLAEILTVYAVDKGK